MKKVYFPLLTAICVALIPGLLKAQFLRTSNVWIRYSQNSVIIPSDTNTRSALLCNLLADRSGSGSPIIGTGTWIDQDKEVKVSSLLYFDLSSFKQDVHPNDIIKAWLLMVPLNSSASLFNSDNARIRIRKIMEPWDDSANWSRQPAATSQYAYRYSLGRPDSNNYYRFNVTRLLRQMVKGDNYGFEISYNEKDLAGEFGRLYYSPRAEDSLLRPLLLIEFNDAVISQVQTRYMPDNNIDNFSRYNQVMPMYDRQQMIRYVQPEEPSKKAAIPDTPPPPVKSDN